MIEFTDDQVQRILRILSLVEDDAKLIAEDDRTHSIAAHKGKRIRLNVTLLREFFEEQEAPF